MTVPISARKDAAEAREYLFQRSGPSGAVLNVDLPRRMALRVIDHVDSLADRLRDAEEALRRIVEHTPADTLTYEQVRELGRAALRDAGGEQA